jgi:hypothetical protein
MLTALRSALIAMLLGLALASTGVAGAPDTGQHVRGRASLLTDAELETVSGGASEACREDEPTRCVMEPRVGPITRIILWDERAGSRVRRLSDLLGLASRRIGGGALLDPSRRP